MDSGRPSTSAELLANSLRELTHFLDGLWAIPDPRAYMCEVIERIIEAGAQAESLQHLSAAVKAQHVLRRVRIAIGRDRDVLWCDTPEAAVELVEQRMAEAYARCGRDMEDLAAELLVVPADQCGTSGRTDTQADLVSAVRELGPLKKRHQNDVLSHLAKKGLDMSVGYAKQCFAELVRQGVLVKGTGGYRLPEWSEKG